MSLDTLFAALKLDDASAIVAGVKKDGVEKSGLASNIEVLRAKCASKDDAEAIAGMKTVTALCAECPEAQAFTKECLLACKFRLAESRCNCPNLSVCSLSRLKHYDQVSSKPRLKAPKSVMPPGKARSRFVRLSILLP
jgi:hypothetical protein